MEVSQAVIQEFVQECVEILQRVSENLESIERESSDNETLNAIYRDMHTMKGSSQLLGFRDLGAIAHALESSLDPIRKLGVAPSPALIDTIYDCLNLIDTMIKELKENNSIPPHTEEIQVLVGALIDRTSRLFHGDFQLFREPTAARRSIREEAESETARLLSLRDLGHLTESTPPAETTAQAAPLPEAKLKPETVETEPKLESADSSIRVNVTLLDRLMNLMGEMVLVRNQVLQHANETEDLSFLALSQRLDVVTNELQDQVMRTRMQPIGNVVGSFQRLVRELAKDLGKKIDLTVQGKDTELDKTLLEAIKDPLTHIVRNSCDHGVENPQERIKAGKPETGHVLISAFHEGGQVTVEVSDDGRGLNRAKILKKAEEKALVTAERAATISDRDLYQLIFLPGFSTADQVSAVSGRGVGMDVVKTNVEKIGGTVELSSNPGKGSTIRLKVPLTLAIVPIMLVKSGGESYAIPQVNLVELVRAGRSNQSAQIETLQGRPVLRLRGSLLPLVDLASFLGGSPRREDLDSVNVVVIRAEGEPFGLIVDEVSDTADIVVKPLSKFLKALDIYSGATILGNGTVALILDVAGMSRKCKLTTERREEMDFRTETNSFSDLMEYLVFKLRRPGLYCLPLCLVHRLEEFPRSAIETTGKSRVVQYRGSILPLLDLETTLGGTQPGTSENISVIVIKKSDRFFGIEVSEILDVVFSESMIEDASQNGELTMGNLLLDGTMYVIVDALGAIEREFDLGPAKIDSVHTRMQEQRERDTNILYVEDVAFFRKQVGNVLEKAGYNVVTAPDGQAAIDLLRTQKNFRLILSDIEMPRMNGYEFARSVRGTEGLKNTPLLALTTRFHKSDVEEGMRSGFNGYLEKLNPEKLLSEIGRLLGETEEKRHGA